MKRLSSSLLAETIVSRRKELKMTQKQLCYIRYLRKKRTDWPLRVSLLNFSYRTPRMVASICAWASFCWCLSIFSMCTSGCAVTLMCAGFQVPCSSKKW